MDFEPTEERRMLADTLARTLADRLTAEHRARIAYAEPWHDPELWDDLAELGLFYALAPEAAGGMGGAGFDIATVFEEIGRGLCPEPVLGAAMAVPLLSEAGADLEALITGAARYAVCTEPGAVRLEGDRLTGRAEVVYGGAAADRLLVAATREGRTALFEVAAKDAEVQGFAMIDGGGAATIRFDGSPATCLIADAGAALDRALDTGRLALAAEAVGAMDQVFKATLDYLKTRKQFGTAIGSFQAVQHRMVDVSVEIEQARSIVILAADRLGGPEGPRAVAMAKSLVGRIAQMVAEEAIQLHGGIAMTWEYPVSHYAKRLVMIDHQLGDTDTHKARVMADLST